MTPPPLFSIIVPTRQRLASLRQLLDSLARTTAHPEALEIVLVVDADDSASLSFRHPLLTLTHVAVSPGQTMGTLNGAGYQASRGQYVMLLNDDVIARTAGWDDQVLKRLRRFPDGIVLVHVNDTLMRENLCTFPIVSRTFCELAGGNCPPDYIRYRIDDHIEDVFNLLGCLGHKRTIYLPDVIFEHQNAVERAGGPPEYHSLPDLLALDAPRFLALFPDRKRLVLRLLEHIEGSLDERQVEAACHRLQQIIDPFALRRPGRLIVETDVPLAHRVLRHIARTARRIAALWRRALTCYREKGGLALLRAARRRLLLQE